ncbi:hypothetical protein OPT61_g10554 [Boeremia exigua]|uniref:Uncharacterized protein n=1 Tax=Boeremia exigua TaxID=749465 RepID=A0ACC2HPP4_9PLEO|nr:hypothetical protein OPT61_g10554 [Boeremia exigua]
MPLPQLFPLPQQVQQQAQQAFSGLQQPGPRLAQSSSAPRPAQQSSSPLPLLFSEFVHDAEMGGCGDGDEEDEEDGDGDEEDEEDEEDGEDGEEDHELPTPAACPRAATDAERAQLPDRLATSSPPSDERHPPPGAAQGAPECRTSRGRLGAERVAEPGAVLPLPRRPRVQVGDPLQALDRGPRAIVHVRPHRGLPLRAAHPAGLGRHSAAVRHRIRELGDAEPGQEQRDPAAHGALGLQPCAQHRDEYQARVVGALHRARQALDTNKALFDRPGERRALCDAVPHPDNGGHGARAVPAAGPPGHPEAVREPSADARAATPTASPCGTHNGKRS